MRIALLSWESLHSIAVGGVAQHVTELAAALCRQGHDVHVFPRIAPGQSDYDCIDGVHYYRCAYQGHNEFVDDINNMCRAFVHRMFGVEDSTGRPFDIIHAHDWLTANAMIWAKKGRRRRGMLTIHATEYGRSGNVFHNGRSARVREQERAGTYWADHIIAVSNATRDEVMWMYEVPEWKCSVVYNGVSRQRFDRAVDVAAVRRRCDIGPMDPVVLFCGRLDYQKGPDILLEAFPQVLATYRNAKLVFAGDGGMRHQLEHRARQLSVAHATRFLGYRSGEEIVDIFKMCDAVAAPSRNEPFGIVVLEAWCASKPVIVTQNGGPSEYVWHEVNGLRIFDNPNSVSWGIHQLFGDFDRARWMGANGRRAVDTGFTWDLVAEQTLMVYDPQRAAAPAEAPSEMATATTSTDSGRTVADTVTADETATPTDGEHRTAAANGAKPATALAVVRSNGNGAAQATVDDTVDHGADGADHADTEPSFASRADLELSVIVPGDHRALAEQLHRLEQVLDRWRCRTHREKEGLLIGGDWQTMFDAMRDACQALQSNSERSIHTRLTLVPRECGQPRARSASSECGNGDNGTVRQPHPHRQAGEAEVSASA
ncbi:MAG: glycosyltransferase family 4 protein [Phycisphaeraceae bacterium]